MVTIRGQGSNLVSILCITVEQLYSTENYLLTETGYFAVAHLRALTWPVTMGLNWVRDMWFYAYILCIGL